MSSLPMRTCPCHGTDALVPDPSDPHVDHTPWCQVWTGIALDWLVLGDEPDPLPIAGMPEADVILGYVVEGNACQIIAPFYPGRDQVVRDLLANPCVVMAWWQRTPYDLPFVMKDEPVL